MDQDWLGLSFLHWAFPPGEVQELLPQALRVDTFEGRAWVGLVPFLLRVRFPHGPAVPWLGVFPETNVRTYVLGPDGPGIWFMSLDAPRRLAIWAARRTYHLPYRVAAAAMQREPACLTYASRRLSGPHRGAGFRARVHVGDRIASASVTPLEHFLTDRWRLYAPIDDGVGTAIVEHAPWQLHRASAEDIGAGLLVAAHLAVPRGAPLVHAAGDVHASLSRLTPCAGSNPGGSEHE